MIEVCEKRLHKWAIVLWSIELNKTILLINNPKTDLDGYLVMCHPLLHTYNRRYLNILISATALAGSKS